MKIDTTTHAATQSTVDGVGADAVVLSTIREKLELIEKQLTSGMAPQTWSVEDIGEWLGLSKYTTSQRVVTRPGFPQPIVPAGIPGAQKRWFADEVIEWFRQNRGALPKACAARQGGRPRGRPRTKPAV